MQMRLRRGLAAVLVLACAMSVAPAPRAQDNDAKELPGLEKGLWAAWAKGDPAPFQKRLATNVVEVNAEGVQIGKAKVLEGLSKGDCKVADYSVGPIQVTRINDATAVLTYTATQDATCGGRKMPHSVSASAVWVKQGGEWLEAVYHESPDNK